jgi:hypothetical protein
MRWLATVALTEGVKNFGYPSARRGVAKAIMTGSLSDKFVGNVDLNKERGHLLSSHGLGRDLVERCAAVSVTSCRMCLALSKIFTNH